MLIGVKLIVGSCFEIIDQFVDFDLLLISFVVDELCIL